MNAAIANATNALYAFIDDRLAAWGEQHRQEGLNAKWQEDSYYRYNLLRLLQYKQKAIDDAVALVKQQWQEAMAAERTTATDFRGTQRQAFASFTDDIRAQIDDAMAWDEADLNEIIDTKTDDLAQRLDQQQDLLEEAMNTDRAEMKAALKEVYNYNNYDLDEAKNYSGAEAPYKLDQHRAFLSKLAYFMKDQLRKLDARLANMRVDYAAQVATHAETAMDLVEDLQWAVQDQRDFAEKDLARLASDLLETYGETTDTEYALLQDSRAAAEAGMATGFEASRKNVIYAIHVLRYAGGEDLGAFGFGNFASSYYGKGNSLTGIDELDSFRLPNSHGYAQVADEPKGHINNDDSQTAKLEILLGEAKAEFDAMLQACRDEFGALVAGEK